VITSYSHDFNFRLSKRQEGFKLNSPATKEVGGGCAPCCFCCCCWGGGRAPPANKNGTARRFAPWSRHGNLCAERGREPCAVAIARLYANKCLLNSWNENECRCRQVAASSLLWKKSLLDVYFICFSFVALSQPYSRKRFLYLAPKFSLFLGTEFVLIMQLQHVLSFYWAKNIGIFCFSTQKNIWDGMEYTGFLDNFWFKTPENKNEWRNVLRSIFTSSLIIMEF